jgi:hypothetical protein
LNVSETKTNTKEEKKTEKRWGGRDKEMIEGAHDTHQSGVFAELVLVGCAAGSSVAGQVLCDVVALGEECVPVSVIPLLDVTASVKTDAAGVEEMAVGTPVGRDAGVGIVFVEVERGGGGGGGDGCGELVAVDEGRMRTADG